VKFSKRPERNKRNTRILPEQEQALFDALPKLWRKRQRTEMHRRLIAAIDLGLREGEMLKVQVKHVDFATSKITLPAEVAKGGATTDRAESVYAMTPRVRQVLEERKELGPDAYVFGAESGSYVASFDKSWRELFGHAGLPVGRKNELTWHDLRHEFVSFLADSGGEIHEVKEAARHKDIRTTERYKKAREERLRALMAKMADRSA
jgi:integrase